MPERITITNYSNRVLAHPQFPAIPPGQTKSRTLAHVDLDSHSGVYDRMAAAGVLVRFDDVTPKGVSEVDAATTITPDQNLIVATASGFTLTLPALADVPPGHRLSIALREGEGNLTVTPNGTETIQGQPTQTLTAPNQVLRLRKESDENWAAQ